MMNNEVWEDRSGKKGDGRPKLEVGKQEVGRLKTETGVIARSAL
jgi:hypothetical protein